jgi:hypothetical protein
VAEIELKTGQTMLVDNADVALLSGFGLVWDGRNGYVRAIRGKYEISVHRLIAGAGPKDIVDHANMNTLDNRTANLRLTDKSGNGANRGADRRRAGKTSRYKGVVRKVRTNGEKWEAYIHVRGKTRRIGQFDTEDEAGIAYNEAALEAWGEMARLNIIGGDAK